MCGLAGIVGGMFEMREPEAGALALSRLRHRGPDDEGTEAGPGWWLGFRRLSILDLSDTGHQPMFTQEHDAVLVLNGEIYNFRELRKELEAAGEVCRSTGDAEVVLRMVRRYGRDALTRLNGMFALAFIDLRARRFLLARDRLGVKPLYLARTGQQLRFASELDALLALMPSKPGVDRVGLARYMAFGQIAAPRTIWEGVSKLEPGSYLEGSLDEAAAAEHGHWWTLTGEQDDSLDRAGWLDRIDAALGDATKQRLISDVPVGLFLSGGIDSGLIAHYARRCGNGAPIALIADFAEEDYSEADLASATATHVGLEARKVRVAAGSLDDLGAIAWHCGEPFADSSIVNQYTLARAARDHATVYLTGDGGDEAFAGYDEYVRMARLGGIARAAAGAGHAIAGLAAHLLPGDSPVLQQLTKLSGGAGGFGALVRRNFRDPVVAAVLHDDWRVDRSQVEEQAWSRWARSAGLPLVTRLQRFDYLQYLEPDVLTKVDRATMAWAVEARSPFLDYRLVELAAKIPARFHVRDGWGKSLLRELAARHLPSTVAAHPKRGFGLPVRHWLRQGLLPRVRKMVGERKRPWWQRRAVEQIFTWHERGRRDLSDVVWRLLMLELWARVYLDDERPSREAS